ncbi:MAG: excinuclease ABC subunit A, partial [Thermoanaerobaculia bacterium]|nr:excinuclease ABC subunit A [Thermoanaerobaculia bacterium]
MSSEQTAILVVGARTHNLKGIDCRIPHGQVTVVTGLSGAGKSSLAFDTVYAEAQRRFVESMSTYARQFLDQMERPPVEAMHNILPAVALEARNSIRSARSTVGTITETHDVLRLLFTHLGTPSCPNGHGPVATATPQEVAERLTAGEAGERFTLIAQLARPAKNANAKLHELVRQGYYRRWAEGEIDRLVPSARWLKAWDPLPLVLGRFRAGEETSSRLAAAVEEAYQLAGGKLVALGEDGALQHFGRELTCAVCGATQRRSTPALFSFNSPLGACPTCQGFGRVTGIDAHRVIPDPSKTLAERPIAPWSTPAYEDLYDELFSACRRRGVPLDVPWQQLAETDREWIWRGEGAFTNLAEFFSWLERRNYKMHLRILLARYRAYDQCPDCRGRRLRPEALAVTLKGETIAALSARSIEQLR